MGDVPLLTCIDVNQSCRCCSGRAAKVFVGELIGHSVSYFECPECGYLQTESPYWLEQAYTSAINDSDTGIMVRNQINARIVLATLWQLDALNDNLVDCAGGYGILVRLLRDYGVNAFWSDRYCENLLAKGFEHSAEPAILVTAFEAFEHFVNPAEELDRLLAIAPNVLFSTEIIPEPAPTQDDWWYYGQEHGQHIGFFRIRTLERLAIERGKFFISDGRSYHLIASKPINKFMWRVAKRVNGLMSILMKRRLKSKTWSDHELMAQPNR